MPEVRRGPPRNPGVDQQQPNARCSDTTHPRTFSCLAFATAQLLADTMSRSHHPSTTPMDFEWTNQTGPIDAQSPFLAASQQKKRKHSPTGWLDFRTWHARWNTTANPKALVGPRRPPLRRRLPLQRRLCDANSFTRPRQPHDILQPRSEQALALHTSLFAARTHPAQPLVDAHPVTRH